MGYVDNFGVLATSAEAARSGADAIFDALAAKGLRVYAVEQAQDSTDFLGLTVDLKRRQLSIKAGCMVGLRDAIETVPDAGRAAAA